MHRATTTREPDLSLQRETNLFGLSLSLSLSRFNRSLDPNSFCAPPRLMQFRGVGASSPAPPVTPPIFHANENVSSEEILEEHFPSRCLPPPRASIHLDYTIGFVHGTFPQERSNSQLGTSIVV